ncbi:MULTISPECIES: hypothetical protein [Cytobacillus]|uniref:Uncharacterized protein n=3 Tax=Bacillati TaxID=1783272 RepID=A0A2N0ZMZ4_9BACI|nr:hypothetical protein [Cytobacillus horneckiae]MEC1159281.1 hypothetical protein [Cytobacillus horneckiae]PKG30875.1 hypothetical protein CWS20_00850 [Cytobacillus horneckiae]
MPLMGGKRGFGGGGFSSNRRGTFGQKRNNTWGTTNRNRQADEQRRRQREADKRRRQDEKRRRKLEQDRKRQLEKRKQEELKRKKRAEEKVRVQREKDFKKQQTKKNATTSNSSTSARYTSQSSMIGKRYDNKRDRNLVSKEKRSVRNRAENVNGNISRKDKAKELREQHTKKINQDPRTKDLTKFEKEHLVNQAVKKDLGNFNKTKEDTRKEEFKNQKIREIKHKLKTDPALQNLSANDKKAWAKKELQTSMTNYKKQEGQRAVIIKEQKLKSSLEESKKRAANRSLEKVQEEFENKERIVASDREAQKARVKEKNYQQKANDLRRESQALASKKGLNSFVSDKTRKRQMAELKSKEKTATIQQHTAGLKVDKHTSFVQTNEKISQLSEKRNRALSKWEEVHANPLASEKEKAQATQNVLKVKLNQKMAVQQGLREQISYDEKLSIAKQEKMLSQLELGKAQIESQRFISSSYKKQKLAAIEQSIAKRNRQVRTAELTHDINNKAAKFRDIKENAKAEYQLTKANFKTSKAAMLEKHKKELAQASPEKREMLKRKQAQQLQDLKDRERQILSAKKEEVLMAKKELRILKNDYAKKKQVIQYEARQKEIEAQLKNLEAAYESYNRPRISGSKPHHLMQQNLQTRQALQQELTKLKAEKKNLKSDVNSSPSNPDVKDEKKIVEQAVREPNKTREQREIEYRQQQKENKERQEAEKRLRQEEQRLKQEMEERRRREAEKVEEQRLEQEQYKEAMRQKAETEADALRQEHEIYIEQQQKQQEQNRLYQEQSRQKFEAQEQQRQSFSREQKKEYLEGEKRRILSKSELSEEDFMRIAELESEIDGLVG